MYVEPGFCAGEFPKLFFHYLLNCCKFLVFAALLTSEKELVISARAKFVKSGDFSTML